MRHIGKWVGSLACLLGLVFATPSHAAHELSCTMEFQLSGWSAFYKTSHGTGTIDCSNGQRLEVKLSAKGGGLTFGKTEIDDGIGKFSGLYDIHEVLGHYATAEAGAGTSDKAVKAQVMTKGNVSLALSGKGHGWDLGVAFGGFTIEE